MFNKTKSEVSEHPSNGHTIEVADTSLAYRPISIADDTPTGAQLASAAGITSANEAIVLAVLPDGSLEDVSPLEVVDLHTGTRKFIIVRSDRTYRFVLDGQRFEWPCEIVSGAQVRKLGNVPPEKALRLSLKNEVDRVIEDHDLVNLDAAGIESFYTETPVWLINVQGVDVKSETPSILVEDAVKRAGFDPNAGWQIFLKIKGEPKEKVTLATVVDLSRKGIEKLRLSPLHVDNGQVAALAREFDLLDRDTDYLEQNGFNWQTLIDGRRRWLLIEDYPLPEGYTVPSVILAMDIPTTYPKAQIDMFYTDPPLVLSSGRRIEANQVRAVILGKEYHGWSRHRGAASKWNPLTDSVITHLALVEGALSKEAGQ